ncbi:MAG: hypothetical protein KDK23_13005 [Leptospiraceae bacterium]|nr:hypothetical protein [Leptospiraceae bacterium]
MTTAHVIAQIQQAFANSVYPGDDALIDSYAIRDDEVIAVEAAFQGQTDWSSLPAGLLEMGDALSFLSDIGFHFFLPAFLIADLRSPLDNANPVFHLTWHFQDELKDSLQKIARVFWPPDVDRQLTYNQWGERRFSHFSPDQCKAIVAYLAVKIDADPFSKEEIEQALLNFWWARADV